MFGKIIFCTLFVLAMLIPPKVEAQVLGTRYFWIDSLYTTTSEIDSAFTYRWEQVTFYTDTIDIWLKVAGSDTNDWASRKWLLIESGTSISFGPSTPVRRATWKARVGVGWMYIAGYKRQEQY